MSGTLIPALLREPWFALPPPKSTGREHFNLGWLEQHLRHFPGVAAQDVQTTLVELNAITISQQVQLNDGCDRLLVCGSGSRNPLLIARSIRPTCFTGAKVTPDNPEAERPRWVVGSAGYQAAPERWGKLRTPVITVATMVSRRVITSI